MESQKLFETTCSINMSRTMIIMHQKGQGEVFIRLLLKKKCISAFVTKIRLIALRCDDHEFKLQGLLDCGNLLNKHSITRPHLIGAQKYLVPPMVSCVQNTKDHIKRVDIPASPSYQQKKPMVIFWTQMLSRYTNHKSTQTYGGLTLV